MFNIVQVQTIEDCNRRCSFCPNSRRKLSGEKMSWWTFASVIHSLKQYEHMYELHFHLQNEPLLDERLPDFVEWAKQELNAHLSFITNGILLTKELLNEFAVRGIDKITVSDYSRSCVLEDDILEIRYIEELEPTFFNRGGNIDTVARGQMAYCEHFPDKVAINYKGDVIMCCADYRYEEVFGNVNEQPLDVILNSPKRINYEIDHMLGNAKNIPICGRCDRI